MNFADIENAWQSPNNRPSATELERQRSSFAAELRSRRRGFLIFISLVSTVLLMVTGRAALQMISPNPDLDRIDLASEWSFLFWIALPWMAAIVFIIQYRRHRGAHADGERSIAGNLRALLDQNELARSRLKLIAVLHVALLVLLPLVVYQLRSVGKAGDEILVPAFVIWPLIALGIGAALYLRYRRKLIPEKRQLEALLRSYGEVACEDAD